MVPMKSRGICKARAEPRRNLYGALRLPSLGSADTLHHESPLQERSSSISLQMSGIMSLSLHEEAVSNIVAYDSMKTGTVNDTERWKAVLAGVRDNQLVFDGVGRSLGKITTRVERCRVEPASRNASYNLASYAKLV